MDPEPPFGEIDDGVAIVSGATLDLERFEGAGPHAIHHGQPFDESRDELIPGHVVRTSPEQLRVHLRIIRKPSGSVVVWERQAGHCGVLALPSSPIRATGGSRPKPRSRRPIDRALSFAGGARRWIRESQSQSLSRSGRADAYVAFALANRFPDCCRTGAGPPPGRWRR